MPAHVAAEAGVAAAVEHQPAPGRVFLDEQPEAVAELAAQAGQRQRRAPGRAICGSCISRRLARRSGCGPPSASAPAGNPAASPVTQPARSRTELNTPPIGANAPSPSGASSAQPSAPR